MYLSPRTYTLDRKYLAYDARQSILLHNQFFQGVEFQSFTVSESSVMNVCMILCCCYIFTRLQAQMYDAVYDAFFLLQLSSLSHIPQLTVIHYISHTKKYQNILWLESQERKREDVRDNIMHIISQQGMSLLQPRELIHVLC